MSRQGQAIIVPLGEGEEIRFLPIPAGSFRMGQRGGIADEEPMTEVQVAAFWMAETPVTQKQYRLMAAQCLGELEKIEGNKGIEPSHFKGKPDSDQRPVENVNWHEARVVAHWLSQRMRELGKLPEGFRVNLPGEAQWEYACRAGSEREYWNGDGEAALMEVGWYEENSGRETHAVGKGVGHPWGLLDLHGNVNEWTLETYHDVAPRLLVPGEEGMIRREEPPPQEAGEVWRESKRIFEKILRGDRDLKEDDLKWIQAWNHQFERSKNEEARKITKDALRSRCWLEEGDWLARHIHRAAEGQIEASEGKAEANRVLRGGSWYFTTRFCRSAFRFRGRPGNRGRNFGFRLAVVPGPSSQDKGPEAQTEGADPKAEGKPRRDDESVP